MNELHKRSRSAKIMGLIVLVTAIVLFVGWFLVSIVITTSNTMNYKGFADLYEFNKIESYVVEEIDSTTDKRLNALDYVDSYCRKISYDGKEYRLYAYVFETEQDAANYCDLQILSSKHYNYKYGGNVLFDNTCKVYSNNCAYVIEGGNHIDFVQFYSFLTSDFSVSFN